MERTDSRGERSQKGLGQPREEGPSNRHQGATVRCLLGLLQQYSLRCAGWLLASLQSPEWAEQVPQVYHQSLVQTIEVLCGGSVWGWSPILRWEATARRHQE